MTDYCDKVFVGSEISKPTVKVAYVVAKDCGHYTRFCRHSCEIKANIVEARVEKERVLVLQAERRIAADEQATIDFDSDYFKSKEFLCQSRTCKYSGEGNSTIPKKNTNLEHEG